MDLAAALGLEQGAHVALVGGGGKTTLMFALAEALLSAGWRVVTSTTTKIRYSEARRAPCRVLDIRGPDVIRKIRAGVEAYGHVFVGHRILDSRKVEGIPPAFADDLYRAVRLDCLIIEADGAAGLPVKAPAAHEPVIPSSATVVVAVMGLEALGRPLAKDLVFRMDRFMRITGARRGERMTPGLLAKIFESDGGLFQRAPVGARRVAFLNKQDLLPEGENDTALARRLMRGSPPAVERVVAGSLENGTWRPVGTME